MLNACFLRTIKTGTFKELIMNLAPDVTVILRATLSRKLEESLEGARFLNEVHLCNCTVVQSKY